MGRAPPVGRGGITGGAPRFRVWLEPGVTFPPPGPAPHSAQRSSLAHSRLAVHTGQALLHAGRLDAETIGAGREAQPMNGTIE